MSYEMPDPIEVTVERNLYEHVRRFLFQRFGTMLAEQSGSGKYKVFADEVAEIAGETKGTWTRPDLAALVLSRGTFVPFWRADLHTFEVKTAAGFDVTGAHEARAQGRLGHYAWLVFQSVGRASDDSERFVQVLRSAAELGVGVIAFTNEADPDKWRVIAWPRRTEADDAIADEFVRTRFSASTRLGISDFLSSYGWISGGER
jgi:hypothetical protein